MAKTFTRWPILENLEIIKQRDKRKEATKRKELSTKRKRVKERSN
jgi:hypothetical protein